MILLSTDTVICKIKYKKHIIIQTVQADKIDELRKKIQSDKVVIHVLCYKMTFNGIFWSKYISTEDAGQSQTKMFRSNIPGYLIIAPECVRVVRLVKQKNNIFKPRLQINKEMYLAAGTAQHIKSFKATAKYFEYGRIRNLSLYDILLKIKKMWRLKCYINDVEIDPYDMSEFNDKRFLESFYNNISDIYMQYKLLKLGVLVNIFLTSKKYIDSDTILVPRDFIWLFQLKYGYDYNLISRISINREFNVYDMMFRYNKYHGGNKSIVRINTNNSSASPVIIHNNIAVRYLYATT